MSSPSITLPRQVVWTRQFFMLVAAAAVALIIALTVLATRPGHSSTRSISRPIPYVGTANSTADNPANARLVSTDCLSLGHAC